MSDASRTFFALPETKRIATVVLATGGARHTQPTAMHGKHSQASERRIEIPAEAG